VDPRVVIAIAAMIAVIAIAIIMDRRRRNPRIRGPALMGTGRILSVEQIGGGDHSVALRIELRVEVGGRQPYDVTVKREVEHIHLARVQTGATFPVRVDETNPQKTGIDFSQSIT
jgi:hypothetical protein